MAGLYLQGLFIQGYNRHLVHQQKQLSVGGNLLALLRTPVGPQRWNSLLSPVSLCYRPSLLNLTFNSVTFINIIAREDGHKPPTEAAKASAFY